MGMNSKTRLMFNLSYIHSYIEDILEICSESDYNYPLIFTDKKSQYAINMCFVQIGEHCAQIRDIDRTFFDNQELRLYEIKGMRDRIVHSYGKIDYNIIKESISKDIPKLKEEIEEIVDEDILDNPYLLYETEYDDYIEENLINDENRLDLFEFLWENIVLEVPLKFTKVTNLSEFHGDGWKLMSEDEVSLENNPFHDLLKNFDKKE